MMLRWILLATYGFRILTDAIDRHDMEMSDRDGKRMLEIFD